MPSLPYAAQTISRPSLLRTGHFPTQRDGYLTHEEFKAMVSSLNIKLSGEQIRSVIRAIDLDGGGFVDFPEFEAAVKRHEDVRDAKAIKNV